MGDLTEAVPITAVGLVESRRKLNRVVGNMSWMPAMPDMPDVPGVGGMKQTMEAMSVLEASIKV